MIGLSDDILWAQVYLSSLISRFVCESKEPDCGTCISYLISGYDSWPDVPPENGGSKRDGRHESSEIRQSDLLAHEQWISPDHYEHGLFPMLER